MTQTNDSVQPSHRPRACATVVSGGVAGTVPGLMVLGAALGGGLLWAAYVSLLALATALVVLATLRVLGAQRRAQTGVLVAVALLCGAGAAIAVAIVVSIADLHTARFSLTSAIILGLLAAYVTVLAGAGAVAGFSLHRRYGWPGRRLCLLVAVSAALFTATALFAGVFGF